MKPTRIFWIVVCTLVATLNIYVGLERCMEQDLIVATIYILSAMVLVFMSGTTIIIGIIESLEGAP